MPWLDYSAAPCRDDDGFSRFRSIWSSLACRGAEADPFCCGPAWQLSFLGATGGARIFYEVSNGGCLVLAEHSVGGRICYTAPDSGWFYGPPFLGPGGPELMATAIARLSSCQQHARPCYFLSGMRPDRALPPQVSRLAADFDVFVHSSSIQCAASLEGGLDGYLSRRSANHRAKLRKAARKAVAAGLSFQRSAPATPKDAGRVYARMLAVEARSWKGLGHCGIAERGSREFYWLLIRELALTGCCRVIFAMLDGRDVGFIFGGVAGDFYRGQQFSYDSGLPRLSIGNLMQLEKIRWLCEEGVRRYDMGPVSGPRMAYKRHWTELQMPIQCWLLRPRQPM